MIDKMANGTEQMNWNIGKNDENDVLKAAQQGDSEALECLMRDADVEDMIQEGLLALFFAIESFSPQKGVPFPAYARLCVERRLRSFMRSNAARKHEPLSQAISLDKPPFEDLKSYPSVSCISDPEAFIIGREEHKETLERLFDLLSHFEAQVLQLYLYGLSYDEIACKIGKSRKSVANAMQRVHQKAERL